MANRLCIIGMLLMFCAGTIGLMWLGKAYAGPFQDLEHAHNTGAPMTTILDAKQAVRWENMFTEGRGTAIITPIKQKGNVGLARWDWHRGDEAQHGWLAIEINPQEKIKFFYYTERAPKRFNNALSGQLADGTVTTIGLNMGFSEANPLFGGMSGLAIGAVKASGTLALQHFADLRTCIGVSPGLAGAGWGASAWGAAALIHPIAALVPIGAGIYAHNKVDPLWECL